MMKKNRFRRRCLSLPSLNGSKIDIAAIMIAEYKDFIMELRNDGIAWANILDLLRMQYMLDAIYGGFDMSISPPFAISLQTFKTALCKADVHCGNAKIMLGGGNDD